MLARRFASHRASRRLSGLWALLAVLAAARAASAQEAATVEVHVAPGGQSWSVGDEATRAACDPFCTLHLAPRQYHVTIGDTSTDVLLDTPSEVLYRPALPALRYTGFVLIGAGLLGGGLATYGALKVCASANNPACPNGMVPRSTVNALAAVAAVSFGTAVAGGFMAYFGSESIRVRDLPPPRTSSRFTLAVSGQGPTLGWSLAF